MTEGVFTRKTNAQGALFYYYPGSIYEFRDHIWRVSTLYGGFSKELTTGTAFQNLLKKLEEAGVDVHEFVAPKLGQVEIFPDSWVCSKCGRFTHGELKSNSCAKCGGEIQQLPFVIACDRQRDVEDTATHTTRHLEPCGYVAPPIPASKNCRRCGGTDFGIVLYDPNNLFTLHVVCKTCQDSTLPKTMCDRNCTVCPFVSRPCNTTGYTPRIELAATMDANQPCPNCRQNTKRLALATSNVMAPVSVTAFDDDLPAILDQATFKAKEEMEAKGVSFDHIEKVLALKEIALTRVKSITCTYAFRVGEAKPVNFPDGNAYVIVDNGSAAVFQFDAARLPVDQDEKLRVLHAAAHALIQPAGYVTGLGSESYREYIDPGSNSIMIYSTEPGGCDVLVREPAKLYTWLKRSRAVVHGCKNDCDDGCKSCLYIPNWQCQRFNHDIDRRGLVNLWGEKFLLGASE